MASSALFASARVATETWSTVIPEEKAVAPPAPVRARVSASVPVTVMGSEPEAESLMAETKVSAPAVLSGFAKIWLVPWSTVTSSPDVLVMTTSPLSSKEAVTPRVASSLMLSTTLWAVSPAAIAIAVPPLIVKLPATAGSSAPRSTRVSTEAVTPVWLLTALIAETTSDSLLMFVKSTPTPFTKTSS